jgi:hypothetical protein
MEDKSFYLYYHYIHFLLEHPAKESSNHGSELRIVSPSTQYKTLMHPRSSTTASHARYGTAAM